MNIFLNYVWREKVISVLSCLFGRAENWPGGGEHVLELVPKWLSANYRDNRSKLRFHTIHILSNENHLINKFLESLKSETTHLLESKLKTK